MILTDIKTLVEQIRYKPGWCIRADINAEWNDVLIEVHGRVRNSMGRGFSPIDAHRWIVAPSRATSQSIRRLVISAIDELEDHEFGEWFVVNGTRPFNPH